MTASHTNENEDQFHRHMITLSVRLEVLHRSTRVQAPPTPVLVGLTRLTALFRIHRDRATNRTIFKAWTIMNRECQCSLQHSRDLPERIDPPLVREKRLALKQVLAEPQCFSLIRGCTLYTAA